MLHEPATTLTDYLLALECVWLAIALARSRSAGLARSAFIVLFTSVAFASITGGTVHGFFPDPGSATGRALWLLTLLAIGVTAASMLTIAAWLLAPGLSRAVLVGTVGVAWAAYAAVVLLGSREFVVAIIAYLPAALLLVAALAYRWISDRGVGIAAGILGIALALLGAAGQQAGIGLHPVHFDHNAVYHVVQGVALYLLFCCARTLIEPRAVGAR